MTTHRLGLRSFFTACLLIGCGDPLLPEQLIEGPRVLGARGYPASDPSQSTVHADQDYSIEWLVVGPEGPLAVTGMQRTCFLPRTSWGIPSCEGAPFVEQRTEPNVSQPTFTTVFDGDPAAEQVMVAEAVFCVEETPTKGRWQNDARCSEGGHPLTAVLTQPTEPDNRRPEFAQATLQFDHEPWPNAGCESDAPRITAHSVEHRISVKFEPAIRETVEGTTETIQLNHAATAGDLQGPLSFIEADQSNLEVELRWTSPKTVPPDSVVHFYFVVRDGRGGTDFAHRLVCVDNP